MATALTESPVTKLTGQFVAFYVRGEEFKFLGIYRTEAEAEAAARELLKTKSGDVLILPMPVTQIHKSKSSQLFA